MGQAIADGSPLGQAMVAARRGPVTRIGHCRLCAEGLRRWRTASLEDDRSQLSRHLLVSRTDTVPRYGG